MDFCGRTESQQLILKGVSEQKGWLNCRCYWFLVSDCSSSAILRQKPACSRQNFGDVFEWYKILGKLRYLVRLS